MRVCQFRHIRDCLYIITLFFKNVKHFLKVVKCCKFSKINDCFQKTFDKLRQLAYDCFITIKY